MGERDGEGGGAATEGGEADEEEHGGIGGGEETLEGVEVWGCEDVGERGVGKGFDEEGAVVVAMDGGGVMEASGDGVEAGQGLGEGGLKELGFGGEVKYKYSVGVRVEEEGHVPWMLGESWSSSNESFKVFRCGYGKSLNSLLLLCVFHLKLHVFISLSI